MTLDQKTAYHIVNIHTPVLAALDHYDNCERCRLDGDDFLTCPALDAILKGEE